MEKGSVNTIPLKCGLGLLLLLTAITELLLAFSQLKGPCTLMACSDKLEVTLSGNVPSNYLVRASTADNKTRIIHCLTNVRSPAQRLMTYSLADPHVEEIRKLSPAIDLCKVRGVGRLVETVREDGRIESLAVECFNDERDMNLPLTLRYSVKFNQSGVPTGVSFNGFAPEEVTLSVWSEEHKKIQTLKPTYKVHRPNGPGCPPACRFGEVTIYLP